MFHSLYPYMGITCANSVIIIGVCHEIHFRKQAYDKKMSKSNWKHVCNMLRIW